MRKHKIECNRCHKEEDLKWNGEHFLMPDSWFVLKSVTSMGITIVDWELCSECGQRALEKPTPTNPKERRDVE